MMCGAFRSRGPPGLPHPAKARLRDWKVKSGGTVSLKVSVKDLSTFFLPSKLFYLIFDGCIHQFLRSCTAQSLQLHKTSICSQIFDMTST